MHDNEDSGLIGGVEWPEAVPVRIFADALVAVWLAMNRDGES